ncbi:MAG: hypothetical protein M3N47_14905 [Chloroflexota bacterium]|nr:hypothetical protein [Chloroflexota bacterium]
MGPAQVLAALLTMSRASGEERGPQRIDRGELAGTPSAESAELRAAKHRSGTRIGSDPLAG